jgi:hypothetical protein
MKAVSSSISHPAGHGLEARGAVMARHDLESVAMRTHQQRVRRVGAVLTTAAPAGAGRRSAAPASHHASSSEGCFMPIA